ncbi:MAG: hypothetical protein JWN56_501 [Sphingobacteriales bacterium]|nr:hypothetical protein [Sphingobacteriales bacterium]
MIYLILPGLGDSGPDHWQSYWLNKFPNSIKLIQDNWNEPKLEDWLIKLNETLFTIQAPVVLIAHSLAVSLVLHWDKNYKKSTNNVVGALLVSPTDIESEEHAPPEIWNFAPMPVHKISFPVIVVASEDDPFVAIERARYFSDKWGAELLNIGKKGHINAETQLAYWEEGQEILGKLVNKID